MYFKVLFIYLFLSTLGLNYAEAKVKLGIDRVVENDFEIFKNKRIAILSNNAGRSAQKKLTVELFVNSPNCNVVAIFAPEHGFKTWIKAGVKVPNDTLFGLPVYSLYGSNRRPLKHQLRGIDIVVVDLQDIGIRSYTYISTLYYMMDACAEWGIPIYVLDRPNPMGGLIVDGNLPEINMLSFVGIIPVAYIHGCTIGELSQMVNEEGWLPKDKFGIPRKVNLSIIPLENWERKMSWENTQLPWTPTSPNIPTVDAVRGCAMTGIFGELGIFQISLGTTLPFQYFGKIAFDNIQLITGSLKLSGIRLEPVYRETTTGIRIIFDSNSEFQPYTAGIQLALAVRKHHPELFEPKKVKNDRKIMFEKVTGTKTLFELLFSNAEDSSIISAAQKGLEEFKQLRAKYLIY